MTACSTHLVLLPGLVCSEELFAEQIASLRGEVAISVADHTRHDTMSGIARAVLATAPNRFALCGLSMGGAIAFEMMRQAPDRIERLALLDTSALSDTYIWGLPIVSFAQWQHSARTKPTGSPRPTTPPHHTQASIPDLLDDSGH